MRKSQIAAVLERRLGTGVGRISSLTQRAAEADLLPTSSGSPYPELDPAEIARMVLIVAVDEGLGSVAATIRKYGGLQCSALNCSLESKLGHLLTRGEPIAPAHAALTVYVSDRPAAVLKTATPDGAVEYIFASIPTAAMQPDGAERIVHVSGAALAGIAYEIAGASPEDVDRLLADVTTPRWQPDTAAA